MHLRRVDAWLESHGEPALTVAVFVAGIIFILIAVKGPAWVKAAALGVLVV